MSDPSSGAQRKDETAEPTASKIMDPGKMSANLDRLRPARGLLLGLLLAAVAWAVLITAWRWLT